MIDNSKILQAASQLVGFKQINGITLDEVLTYTPSSGIYVNAMPGVDLNLAEEALKLFSPGTPYQTLSMYLYDVRNEEIINVVNKFLLHTKNKIESKELIANHDITLNSQMNLKIQNGAFVGYHIKPRDFKSLLIQITQIALQIDTPQTIRLFVYELHQKTAIATFDVSINKAFDKVFKTVTNLFTNFQTAENGSNLEYLVGYYEYQLHNPQTWQLAQTTQAYTQQLMGCCGTSPLKKILPYTWLSSIQIPSALLNADYSLPNITPYTVINNYCYETAGLALKFSINCDITAIICSNIYLFAQSIANKIASRILLDIYSTTEMSANLETKRVQCKTWAAKYEYELTGYTDENNVYHYGLLDTLVRQDFSGVDEICLPCKKYDEISIAR